MLYNPKWVWLGITIILITIFAFQAQRIGRLKSDTMALEAQISTLEAESQMQAQRYENARIQANEAIRKSQEHAKEIMLANVPQDCMGAIKWGKDQANAFA